MSNPYVTKVTFLGKQIVLTIQVDELTPGDSVEISGHATQNGGAFAVFNDIQQVPKPNLDGTAFMYVKASPSEEFKKGHPVTVVLRAARVWTTVLGEPQSGQGSSPDAAMLPTSPDDAEPAGEGTTWSDVRKVTYAAPLSTGDAGQTSTGSGASFQDT